MTSVARIPSGWVFDSGGHRCVIDINNLWKNMCSIGSLLSYCTALIFEYQGLSERAPASGRVRRTPFAGETRPAITTHNRIPWWRLHRSVTGRRRRQFQLIGKQPPQYCVCYFCLARFADLLYVYYSVFCFLSLTHAQHSKFAFSKTDIGFLVLVLDWTVQFIQLKVMNIGYVFTLAFYLNVLSNASLAC